MPETDDEARERGWAIIPPNEKHRILARAYDRAFAAFLRDLDAAGSWLGLEKEAARLASDVEARRMHRLENDTLADAARTGTDDARECGFSSDGEMSGGELALRVTVDGHEGTCWLSREMWAALGEKAGFVHSASPNEPENRNA